MTKIISKLAATIALGTIALGTAAIAAPEAGAHTVEISVKGIDMKSPEGRARFDRLTRAAARQVCNVGIDSNLSAVMTANKCFKRAVSDARAQIAQLHNGEQVALLTNR